MTEPLIEFKKVSKRFESKVVLDKVDLSIYPAEVTTLLGKSGVGKSVTLKLIMGLMLPDEGEILYKGRDLSKMDRKERTQMKQQVNFMFQSNALFDSMNIYDNIGLPLKEGSTFSPKEIHKRVQEKIDFLELTGSEEKYPAEVSGGMQKRVALARALVTRPQVVLFDEPTTGLDPVRKINVLAMIVDNQKRFGFTGILVSHDVPDVFYVSNRIILIDQGQVVFQGNPLELEHNPHAVVREFIDSQQELENRVISLNTGKALESDLATFYAAFPDDQEFTLVLLVIDNIEGVKEELGLITAHKLLARISGVFLRSVSEKNGLAGRYSQKLLVGIMPGGSQDIPALSDKVKKELDQLDFIHEADNGAQCVNFRLKIGTSPGTKALPFQDFVAEALSQSRHVLDLGCVQWKQRG
ncbi:MAG: ATP-binding cassette domain-containing protein [Desulfohalobiaceae bacterium]|nr:ATP-binding cassette domain-containing protein [Desulfohalobiaceae bacterium]